MTADVAAARTLVGGQGRVLAVFQPSGEARLDAFGAEFGTALAGCDEVVLTGSARSVRERSLRALSGFVSEAGGTVRAVEMARAEAAVWAADAARPGDVVVLIGTGDLIESGPVLRAALVELAAAAV
ncbi:glutamate ligase domain-containing protein [Streptomyces pseudoechinosporeus]